MNYFRVASTFSNYFCKECSQIWCSVFPFYPLRGCHLPSLILKKTLQCQFCSTLLPHLLHQVNNGALTPAMHPHFPSLNISDAFQQLSFTIFVFSLRPSHLFAHLFNFTWLFNFNPLSLHAHSPQGLISGLF